MSRLEFFCVLAAYLLACVLALAGVRMLFASGDLWPSIGVFGVGVVVYAITWDRTMRRPATPQPHTTKEG